MTTRFQASIRICFTVVVVILVCLGAAWYGFISRFLETVARLQRSESTLATAGALLSCLKDYETGQRGYLITGDSAYLGPYQASIEQIRPRFNTLAAQTASIKEYDGLLDRMGRLIDLKMEEVARTIEVRRAEGFEAAAAIVRQDTGRHLMDSVREITRLIEDGERARLARLMSETAQGARTTTFGAVGGSAVLIAILALAYLLTAREATRHVVALAELATIDGLTGLRNRRFLGQSLRGVVEQAGRDRMPISVVMLDLDHFKNYNDTYGHPAGDELLRQVAELLRINSRTYDVVARYGGEEFAVVLPATDLETGRGFAERIRSVIASHDWPHRRVTASVGVATMLPPIEDPDSLIVAADKALYASKHAGRNRATHADDLLALDHEPSVA